MRQLSSPFLHDRDEVPDRFRVIADATEQRQRRDKETQKLTLEKLRYRGYQRRGTLWGVMQRIGDWFGHLSTFNWD